MAIGTLGTSATNSLTSLIFKASNLDSSVATISQGICNDIQAGNSLTSFTGTSNGTAVISGISGISGTLTPGMQMAGPGIPFGATIRTVSATSITLSVATTSSTTGTFYAFVTGPENNAFTKNGLLYVPNRGVLQVLPGDYVAVDPYGWPILISAFSIANGPWTHT